MNDQAASRPRVLSGMRPTGMLHLGHHFLLQKWVELQDTCDCHYFVADYHALTTASETQQGQLTANTRDMVVCWLAAGIDPERATLFVQSQQGEHAELHVILSMVCPLPWLERVPHYKEVVQNSNPEDICYGFLGYPVLQAADIVIHAADYVPVGDDQEAHVELAASIVRAFNERFGKDDGWQDKAKELVGSLADPKLFERLRVESSQSGDAQARREAVDLVKGSGLDREAVQRLCGWLEGGGRQVLVPPLAMKAEVSKLPGLDGGKMSKSENNDIGMLEERESFAPKIKTMPTDPARVKRTDPGDPEKCPVWDYHRIFSAPAECENLSAGCKSAGIGCLDCKGVLIDNIEKVVAPLRERAEPWLADEAAVAKVIEEGNEKARASSRATMREVREAVGLPQP